MTEERRSSRRDRRAGSAAPVRVKGDPEGGFEVEADAVSPRELHANLATVYEKFDALKDQVGNLRIAVWVLAAVTASPKVGGPALPTMADAVMQYAAHFMA